MIPVPGHPRWYVHVRWDGDPPRGLLYTLVRSSAGHLVEARIIGWFPEDGWDEAIPESVLRAANELAWPDLPRDGLASSALAVALATDPAALFLAMEVMTA